MRTALSSGFSSCVIQMTTGERIKLARKNANVTQAELATKLDIPFQSISQWERDVRKPKLETLQRIATALGVSVSSLMDESTSEAFNTGMAIAKHFKDRAKALEYAQWEWYGYTGSDEEKALIGAFSQLNKAGQAIAIERIKELAEIYKYQKL